MRPRTQVLQLWKWPIYVVNKTCMPYICWAVLFCSNILIWKDRTLTQSWIFPFHCQGLLWQFIYFLNLPAQKQKKSNNNMKCGLFNVFKMVLCSFSVSFIQILCPLRASLFLNNFLTRKNSVQYFQILWKNTS